MRCYLHPLRKHRLEHALHPSSMHASARVYDADEACAEGEGGYQAGNRLVGSKCGYFFSIIVSLGGGPFVSRDFINVP